jgi:hypothetical protein
MLPPVLLVLIQTDYLLISHSSLSNCYHWKKLGKVYKGFPCVISYNDMRIYSYINKKEYKRKNRQVLYLPISFPVQLTDMKEDNN